MSRRRILLALTLATLLPWSAQAQTDIKPPAHVQRELGQARLAGAGTFRWFGLTIYDAKFWVGDKGYIPSAPAAARFALDLRYARSLIGAKIAESSQEEMKKRSLGTPEQRTAWRSSMEKLFPDVQDGTRITGVYLPGQGARFYRDGAVLGEIMDPEFALAFFGIWLDVNTTGKSLRDALLADAAPR